ncbi:sensor domain-containing protein [Peribacillus kribbensis]|uniref:sensor domain-containing protein n=1 Tax=Peribacillus kribbensis TaxID=356658 RepID=UPI00040692FD|nr:EAL domain-containing protein [Peribacillus kribbensis]
MQLRKKYSYVGIVILVFILILSELVEVTSPSWPPHAEIVMKGISYLFSLGSISLLLYYFFKNNETTKLLTESTERLKNIFESLDIAIWSHDLKTDTLLITPGIEKLYGYSLNEFYKNRNLWKEVIPEEDRAVLVERQEKIQQGKKATSVYRIVRPNGEIRWIRDSGIPVYNQKKELIDFTSVLFDITHQKESESRYQSLVEMSPDFIAIISNRRFEYINRTGVTLLGAECTEQIIGTSIDKYLNPDFLDQSIIPKLMDDKSKMMTFETVLSGSGKNRDIEVTLIPIQYEGRQAWHAVGRDISERKKAEQTIHQMAYHDALTGLPNRNLLSSYFEKMFRQDMDAAVLFLDLDRFKLINDTKGHSVGDKLLIRVADRIKNALKDKGIVSRYSGDEFIVLLENLKVRDVKHFAETILKNMEDVFRIDDEDFYITTSIGISMYPEDGHDAESLIQHADAAMYLAKERGKNNYQFFSTELNKNTLRKMELENGLRKALELNQLVLHYQPQYHLESGEISGIEALVRWQHPDLGLIPPNEFISLAEETGLIVSLGKWVLRTAVNQNKKWLEAGFKPIPVAVNISVRQLQENDFTRDVALILEEAGLNPEYLELEITESMMHNTRKVEILKILKKMGMKIVIDDFGTGYSSLNYLKHLPIDKIKIDKAFVDDIHDSINQGLIANAIIDIGTSLNFEVIAEGIEEKAQVDYLIKSRCSVGQGYYFSRPLPADQMRMLLSYEPAAPVVLPF